VHIYTATITTVVTCYSFRVVILKQKNPNKSRTKTKKSLKSAFAKVIFLSQASTRCNPSSADIVRCISKEICLLRAILHLSYTIARLINFENSNRNRHPCMHCNVRWVALIETDVELSIVACIPYGWLPYARNSPAAEERLSLMSTLRTQSIDAYRTTAPIRATSNCPTCRSSYRRTSDLPVPWSSRPALLPPRSLSNSACTSGPVRWIYEGAESSFC